jgi:hypothetical protein
MRIQPTSLLNRSTPINKIQGGNIPATNPPSQPLQIQAGVDYNNWSPKGSILDSGYDAYKFSQFPLSLGGVSLWSGSGFMRSLASAFSGIPTERLEVYNTRSQLMRVPGMKEDYARLLQMAYTSSGTNLKPMQWLAQYAAAGDINDYLLRGPLLVSLNLFAGKLAVDAGFVADVPGNNTLKALAQEAAKIAPPPKTN